MQPGPHSGQAVSAAGWIPMRVLIVDDHDAVRAGVLKLFEEEPDVHAEGVAGGQEAVLASRRDAIDVVVVDYQLAHGEDGLAVITDIRRLADPPRVLLYSAYADAPLGVLALLAGADGLLSKGTLGLDLVQAVRDVWAGRRRWPRLPGPIVAGIGARLPAADQPLFRMWVDGARDAEVGRALGLTADELELRRAEILGVLAAPPGLALVGT
jgi:DNA-binding NarL/FixJ family response regulator